MRLPPAYPWLLAAVPLAACAGPQARVEAFKQVLLSHDSATAALAQWCAARGLAEAHEITAAPLEGPPAAPPADLRALLEVGADEPLGYRHVGLRCGALTLSEAHNWYVPARLPESVNDLLADGHTPFGIAAAPTRYTRTRLPVRHGRDISCPADTILTHRGLLKAADGKPIALVIECYTSANIAD